MKPLLAVCCSLLVSASLAIRLAILNDVHLNTTTSSHFSCGFPFCNDHGLYDFDSPLTLVTTLLDDMKAGYGNIDAILIQGDHIVHGLSTSSPSSNYWPQQKAVLQTLVNELKKRFPATPMIFSIGNNDVLQHYAAPVTADKAMYYGDLHSMWFTNIPGNAQWASSVQSSFLNGGYYEIPLTPELSVLVINSIYFNVQNSADLATATTQLQWLQNLLDSAPASKRFILSMHIPPALFYFTGV